MPFFRSGERVDIGPSALLEAWEELGAAAAAAEPSGSTLRSRCDLVVLPSQFLVRAELVPELERFVRAGGQLLIGPHSGVVDQDVRAHLGGLGGGLLELAGVFREEPWPLAAPIVVRDERGEEAEISGFVEVLRTTTARSLWSVTEGPLQGRPVVTHRELGAGAVWYVGGLLEPETLQAVIGQAASAAALELSSLPEQVEVIRRGEAVVILNHGSSPARLSIAGADLEVPGEELMVWRPA